MRKILPISLIHIYWCETLGWEKVPAPTHPPPQPGQVSTKNRLHVTQILLFVSRLAPEPTPHSPLGLPSNHGRVAETFSLLQAKARQSCGPRGGYRVLRERAPWRVQRLSPMLRALGPRVYLKPEDITEWWEVERLADIIPDWTGLHGKARHFQEIQRFPRPPAVLSVLSHFLSLVLCFLLNKMG